MGTIVERLREYLERTRITVSNAEKTLDVSNGALSKPFKSKTTIKTDTLEKFLNHFTDINADWLLTGKGEMLRGEVEPGGVKVFNSKKDTVVPTAQDIPLYDLEASAGIVSLFSDSHDNPIDHIRIPGIPKCDGALKVSGDSMYPLLKSGDIVMYKQMHEFVTGIYVYGEMYIIGFELHGDVFVVVKYIHKSEQDNDHIKLVSQNQHHDDFEIPKSSIKALAMVKASIRINSMK